MSFSHRPPSTSPCPQTTPVLEAPSQQSQTSSSKTSTAAPIHTISSSQPATFVPLPGPQQTADVPGQAPVQTPNQATPKHYVALPSTFLQLDRTVQTAPLAPPVVSAPPPMVPALTTAAPGTAAVTVVAATTTDTTAAAHTVPLATNPTPTPSPVLAPTTATITIAPTQSLLQPSLVMSDQNLQWILSSAANSQQNPDQAVSSAPDSRVWPV